MGISHNRTIGVKCGCNDTTLPLCGLDGPEKTSPDETHFVPNLKFTSIRDKLDIFCLHIKCPPTGFCESNDTTLAL